MHPPETTILVRRAQEGDPDGLAALVERVSPLLLAQARYRLRGSNTEVDAEDVVQEVWTRALPRLPELSEREGRATPVLLKFLATTLLYRVHELLRERIRRRRQEGASGVTRNIPAETIGVISCAVRAERRDQLWEALDTLDPDDRELLILRGIEQQENKAVAEKLGETPNAVSLRYNRILSRLRSRLSNSILDEF